MPRRIPDFPDSFHSWNFLSSIGSGITLLSFAMFSFSLCLWSSFGKWRQAVSVSRFQPRHLQLWAFDSSLSGSRSSCDLDNKSKDAPLEQILQQQPCNTFNTVKPRHFFIPGLDNTRLFMSFTAGAGTRCMTLLSSSPILLFQGCTKRRTLEKIPCYGEFTQRSDPWAGLIASCGSFYPMVHNFEINSSFANNKIGTKDARAGRWVSQEMD